MSEMTIEETLAAALDAEGDRWTELLFAVVMQGATVTLEQVARLLGSDDPAEQALGADLAGRVQPRDRESEAKSVALGFPAAPDYEEFDDAQRAVVAALLREALETSDSDLVVESAAIAASMLRLHELAPAIVAHAAADDADVREAVAFALGSLQLPQLDEQIAILVRLAYDPVVDVRSWALFALRTGIEEPMVPVATPEAVAAYRANADDPEDEVSVEAEEALALLGDVEMMVRTIQWHSHVDSDVIDLAAELGDPRLHEPLVALRASLDEEENRTTHESYVAAVDAAITATASPA